MTLITCPDCSRRISNVAAACLGCGRPVRVYVPPARGDAVMDGLRAYVGPNWDSHYRYAFGQLLYSERKGTGGGWTWNWSAALVPYGLWLLYRRLYGAAGLLWLAAFAGGLAFYLTAKATPFSGLVEALVLVVFSVAQGFLGDRLLFAKARATVGDGTSVPLAELERKGAPHRWVIWTGVSTGVAGTFAFVGLVLFSVVQTAVQNAETSAARGWSDSPIARTTAREDGWVWFQSGMGDFRAAFPRDPTYSTSVGGKENRYTTEYRDGAVLQVTYGDEYDPTMDLADHFRHLETSPDISGPIRPTPISFAGHPGMVATYRRGEGADEVLVEHRMLEVEGRIYQVIAAMKEDDPAREEEMKRFFASFTLTQE